MLNKNNPEFVQKPDDLTDPVVEVMSKVAVIVVTQFKLLQFTLCFLFTIQDRCAVCKEIVKFTVSWQNHELDHLKLLFNGRACLVPFSLLSRYSGYK